MALGLDVVQTTNSFLVGSSGARRHMTMSVCSTPLENRAPPEPPTYSVACHVKCQHTRGDNGLNPHAVHAPMILSMSSMMMMLASDLYAFEKASMMAACLAYSPRPTSDSAEMRFTSGKALSAASCAQAHKAGTQTMSTWPRTPNRERRAKTRCYRTLAAMAVLPVPGGPWRRHEIMFVRELFRSCARQESCEAARVHSHRPQQRRTDARLVLNDSHTSEKAVP